MFFRNGDYDLFGVLHTPDAGASSSDQKPLSKMALVFCHPFGEEKLFSHRIMVNLARYLTREGAVCLRFDYMGHGDSHGHFEDSTVQTRKSDICCAMEFLRSQSGRERTGVLGLRFGATLAALVASETPAIDPLVLIAPIHNGKDYLDQCLRSNLATQMAFHRKILKDRAALVDDFLANKPVNVDGYLVSGEFYKECVEIDLLSMAKGDPRSVLVLQVSKREGQPVSAAMKQLHETYIDAKWNASIQCVQDLFFWMDQRQYKAQSDAIEQTVKHWLSANCQ